MANKTKETIKANNADTIQAGTDANIVIHEASIKLLDFLCVLSNQHEDGYINCFDNFTAEDYLQFKSDLRSLHNVSASILDILEKYEDYYF